MIDTYQVNKLKLKKVFLKGQLNLIKTNGAKGNINQSWHLNQLNWIILNFQNRKIYSKEYNHEYIHLSKREISKYQRIIFSYADILKYKKIKLFFESEKKLLKKSKPSKSFIKLPFQKSIIKKSNNFL